MNMSTLNVTNHGNATRCPFYSKYNKGVKWTEMGPEEHNEMDLAIAADETWIAAMREQCRIDGTNFAETYATEWYHRAYFPRKWVPLTSKAPQYGQQFAKEADRDWNVVMGKSLICLCFCPRLFYCVFCY